MIITFILSNKTHQRYKRCWKYCLSDRIHSVKLRKTFFTLWCRLEGRPLFVVAFIRFVFQNCPQIIVARPQTGWTIRHQSCLTLPRPSSKEPLCISYIIHRLQGLITVEALINRRTTTIARKVRRILKLS